MAQSPASDPHVPIFAISDNLTRAAGVLQDMQTQGKSMSKDHMPGSPPALFGAGGPMSVFHMLITSLSADQEIYAKPFQGSNVSMSPPLRVGLARKP